MKFFNKEEPHIKERVILENELAFAFLNQMPIVPGHVLICPIRAVEKSDDLTFDEWRAIIELKKEVCRVLKTVFGAEGFNFAWNVGEKAGQTVPHFHLHVLPRKEGDAGIYQYEPRVFLYRPGSRAISPKEELVQIVDLMKKEIGEKGESEL